MPGTVNTPVSVIAPFDVTVKLLPTVEAANTVAILLVKETLLAPLFESVTAPVNALFCVKVIALAPALKLDVPGTVNIPVSVIAPFDVTVKLLPTVEAANTVAILLVKETLLAPLFESVTAPVNALFCVKVIALAPALKLDVPGTVNTPVSVIAPPAIALKLPLFVNVKAGNAIAVLSN